jgi:hypothetical protein
MIICKRSRTFLADISQTRAVIRPDIAIEPNQVGLRQKQWRDSSWIVPTKLPQSILRIVGANVVAQHGAASQSASHDDARAAVSALNILDERVDRGEIEKAEYLEKSSSSPGVPAN